MRRVIVLVFSCLALNAFSDGQDQPKPVLSSEHLTAEQVAIYRAVLKSYRKGSHGTLNLADRTEPLQRTDSASYSECLSGIKPNESNSAPIVHRISDSALLGPKLVLVDPDRQQETIDKNDPQNLVKRAIDGHEQVTNQELDDSIKRAFETGVFALSEIAFDRGHNYAIVAYSFVCGGLCGNGATLVVHRVGQTWKVTKRCGEWVS